MNWETISIVAGALVGVGSFVWGIIKYYDTKREKKDTQANKLIQTINDENVKQSEAIDKLTTVIDNLTVVTSDLKEDFNAIADDLTNIHKQLQRQDAIVDTNEKDRLQTELMTFANNLRAGAKPTLNMFNYIFHAYDKYKSLGGNSFVDSEMSYIRKKKEECIFMTKDKGEE